MHTLQPFPKDPAPNSCLVGVAIKKIGPRQNHLGLCLMVDATPALLHHNTFDIALEQAEDGFFWVPLGDGFEPEDIEYLAGHLPIVAKKLQQRVASYGFDGAINYFSKEGEIVKEFADHGLTCASFVLYLFGSLGFQLVKFDEWPEGNSDNKQWQSAVVAWLEKSGHFSKDFVDRQRSIIGVRRYFPQEVLASSQLEFPAGYQETSRLADYYEGELQNFYALPPANSP